MDDKACHAALFHDQLDLGFPQFDRSLIEKMQQSIVLRGSYRDFKNVTNEVGHHAATATVLRIKMRNIGKRHVKREIETGKPLGLPVKHRRTESPGVVLRGVAIDQCNPAQEFFPVVIKPPVVIQVLDPDLKSPLTDGVE